MTGKPDIDWAKLDFVGFSKLAGDERLSMYEKIGFPDSYRRGFEHQIFADIRAKLRRLDDRALSVIDIGPGCSDLPRMLIDLCRANDHHLYLVDSEAMLANLPNAPFIDKRPGLFPTCRDALSDLRGSIDVILCYSVLHYVFVDANVFDFVDVSLDLLAPGGELLIGDIPNISKRRRFFSTESGVAYHRQFVGNDSLPAIEPDVPVERSIDDSVVMSLVSRARMAGADAYVLPQDPALPMANRREDILIRRP